MRADRLLVDDLVEHGRRPFAGERTFAGEELVGHDRDRELIGGPGYGFAHHLLRRHVPGGADHGPSVGHARLGELGDAEVSDLGATVAVEQDVGWLDVPVHHSVLVREVETVADLPDQVGDLLEGEDALLGDHVLERLALDVLHRDVRGGALLADVVDSHDVGVGERPGGAELALEPGLQVIDLLGGDPRIELDDLDRELATDDRVLGQVDDAHGALADDALYLVAAEACGLLFIHLKKLPGSARLYRASGPGGQRQRRPRRQNYQAPGSATQRFPAL